MPANFHTLYFETTRVCNLNCEFCSTGSNGKYDGSGDMTFAQITERVLVPAKRLGTEFIEFSGGEFLLRPDAFDLLQKANEMGFKLAIASNGTTLTEAVIIRLKELLGNNIFISLGINSFDSKNPDTRDTEYTFVKGVIDLLEKYHIGINLCVTFGKFNQDTIADTLANIRELKLPFNRIPFVPRNCHSKHNMPDKKTMREHFIPAIIEDFHGYVSYTPFFLPEEEYRKISGQSEKDHLIPTNPSVGCWCGSFYSINPEGEVSPCALLSDHASGGNVLKQDLEDILKHSELFTKIMKRDELGGKCGKCKFRFTCGGCRAMALYHTGDIYGEDPTCFIDDLTEEELRKMEETTIRNFGKFARMAQMGKTFLPPEAKE